jgi:hypothetical protein
MIDTIDRVLLARYGNVTVGRGGRTAAGRFFTRNFRRADYFDVGLGSRAARYWLYPGTFGAFFGDPDITPFATAIRRRNDVVHRYCSFIDAFVEGRGLYYPWWMRRGRGLTLSRVKRALALRVLPRRWHRISGYEADGH